MADTVKKSRIDDPQIADQKNQEDDTFYESMSASARPIPESGIASYDLLQNERQHSYDSPVVVKNDSREHQGVDEETENIYETLPEYGEIEKTEPSDQNVKLSSSERVEPNLTLDLSPKVEVENVCYEDVEETIESSYEIVRQEDADRPSFSMETTDFSEQRSPEDNAKSVKDRMLLATDDAATLLFTQTVTSPMLTPSEENIDFLKGFQRENINSDSSASNESPPKEDLTKTSEENSTSDISAAMSISDPSATQLPENSKAKEENIYENAEFLKQNAENIYQNVDEAVKEENIYENLKDVQRAVEELEEHEEHIYQDIDEYVEEKNMPKQEDFAKEDDVYESVGDVEENVKISEETFVENSLYSNESVPELEPITDCSRKENINETGIIEFEHYETVGGEEEITEKYFVHSEQVEKHKETFESQSELRSEASNVETVESNIGDSLESKTKETYSEFVYHSKMESNYYEKYTEVVSKTSTSSDISNREKDTETVPPEIVKNLKSQFSKSGAEIVATTKKDEASELRRSINIMEQISKFEHLDSGDGTGIDPESTVTETYTETTTIQSDVPEEKSLKKKKIKKSRKEEKENISVNDFDVVNGENVYNVNVKSLCRSFGDLTKIAEDKDCNRQVRNSGRTKSLSDVLLSSHKKNIENVFSEVSVRALKEKFNIVENKKPLGIVKLPFKNSQLKSSFSKFDALQKKNVLHIRSSDSTKAQEKFTGAQPLDTTNCKACSKQVFQMEQIKAEKAIWHKNCFRCTECSKQLTVETYVSHEGNLYCKPHFKSLFAPKAVEEESPPRPRKPELIIRENQPLELPPDVVRASDKPDLGLEELQSLNVKERFQVFEQYQTETQETDRGTATVNVKRSPSILSKLAKFQQKGMDIGVSDDSLNGIPVEGSDTEEEAEEDVPEGEDPTLYKAKRVQKEKPFHFTNLSEVKNKWEHGEQNSRDERREERKQEIQSIRNKLFMGKQGKMKEAYQQAVMQSESCANLIKSEKIESYDTKSLKERFEKGETFNEKETKGDDEEDTEVFQSEISKKSRSLFLELDANASKAPQMSNVTIPKQNVKTAREAYLAKTASEDTVKSSEIIEDIVEVKTADIQQRFKFFETYKEPEKERKTFRITPPRDPSQVKTDTPEREIYHDPEVVRAEDTIDDSIIAKKTHTTSKMLNKFRQMEEENLTKEQEPLSPKPMKSFTPPPELPRTENESADEQDSGSEEESEGQDQMDNQNLPEDLLEARRAARATQLRAKFEKWEQQEIRREESQAVNIGEEGGDESQIESTRSLRARFESMRDTSSDSSKTQRVKVNRFVEIPSITVLCESCDGKVYPLEKISVHGHVYHKNCFKCMECSCVLRMDSYSYNQGLLYCTPHFKRLFISKGNYDTAFGLGQHKEKWNCNATMA
ncbi:uncharacterized protein isoform X4 [Leptinotarsa decemlineata]|uniref:uncharacterized protein isoform X4 n=1 Tax=Leptinotarsa decemlineata TaxID=7539 RepID=UPI003D3050D0